MGRSLPDPNGKGWSSIVALSQRKQRSPILGKFSQKPCKAKQKIGSRGWFCPRGVAGEWHRLYAVPRRCQRRSCPCPAQRWGRRRGRGMPAPGWGAVGSDSRVYSASSGAPCSLHGEKRDLVCDPWESSLTPQGARGLRLIPSLLARGAGLCLQMLHETGLCRAVPPLPAALLLGGV